MNKSAYFFFSVDKFVRHVFLRNTSEIYFAKAYYFQRYFSSNLINKSSAKHAGQDHSLSLNNPVLEKYLNQMCSEVSSKESTKQSNELYTIVPLWKERQNLLQDLRSLTELKGDKELESLANDEMSELNEKIIELDEQIVSLLVPSDCSDLNPDSLVLEVNAGVGGQEAMLFAAELLDMYQGYVQFKGWNQDIAELDHSELGGLRHGSISISGPGAFLELRHEGGVHRVQRIPKTEKSGRLHTSTVTVAILPQPSEVAIILNAKDLKVETKRSSGAGGQHVNTTDSCVRITHILSGLTVECQTERSQVQNRAKALQRLRARLYQCQLNQQLSQRRDTRKQQVGLSLRSEKIRTYNFPQDRITDHRIGVTFHNLKGFLDGRDVLEDLLQNLEKQENQMRLQALVASLS